VAYVTRQPPVQAPSLLLGAARDLQHDLLNTYARALRDFGGEVVSYRLGPPRIGKTIDVLFQPDAARQVLATDAQAYDKGLPMIDELRWIVGQGW
jgi:hypothetical protein